jgi:respiratory burst oxidase
LLTLLPDFLCSPICTSLSSRSFARGAAEALKFNVALVILLMCRSLLLAIREFGHGALLRFVPVDHHVVNHIVVGWTILILVLIHSFAHVCDFYEIEHANFSAVQAAFPDAGFSAANPPTQASLWLSYPAVTGWVMLLLLLVAYGFVPLRRKSFNKFFAAHQLLLLMALLLMIHGAAELLEPLTAPFYVVIPVVLYWLDRAARAIVTRSAAGRTSVVSAETIGAGGKGKAPTLKLTVTKPLDFEFVAGAYAFLKVPDVSLFEWHPFTIASAPEDEHLIFYCKAVGDWTRATLELFCPPAKPADGTARAERGFPEVRVFGPHGAPSQSWLHYSSVLFVATGVGVTPFLSILRSLVTRASEYRCDECGSYSHLRRAIDKGLFPAKVVFVHMSRLEEELGWCDQVLEDLLRIDTMGVLSVHQFLTGAKRPVEDATDAATHTARPPRPFTVHYGRPDFEAIIDAVEQACVKLPRSDERLRRAGDDKVTCGIFATVPPQLADTITRAALRREGSAVRFKTHIENF